MSLAGALAAALADLACPHAGWLWLACSLFVLGLILLAGALVQAAREKRLVQLRCCGRLNVMPVSAEIRRELLSLPAEEREKLADELYDSLDEEEAGDPEWQSAWTKELQSRISDVEQGRVELIDGDDVHRRLRAKYSKPG
jgi:putative addiction module component (TIGR02574 family)